MLSWPTGGYKVSEKRFTLFFIPALIVAIVFIVLEISWTETLYFLMGYSWNLALLSPEIEKRITHKKYRFSFLKFCFVVNQKLSSFVKPDGPPLIFAIIRSVSPLVFIGLLKLIFAATGSFLYVLGGSILAEIAVGLFVFSKRIKDS